METLEQTVRTFKSTITLSRDGVLRLVPDEDAELDLEEVEACLRCYKEMGLSEENKVVQLIIARGNVTMTKEAREFVDGKTRLFFKAAAVVGTTLTVRLVVNFINRFYRNAVPMKMFEREQEAMLWLKQFKDK